MKLLLLLLQQQQPSLFLIHMFHPWQFQLVQAQDALDLDEQAVQEAEVAPRHTHDRGDRLRVGEIGVVQ